jgi:hypothetical protein
MTNREWDSINYMCYILWQLEDKWIIER